jgi:hypothetical protein
MTTITVEEWQHELERLTRPDNGGAQEAMTMPEIREKLGICDRTAANLVRKAINAGAWECVKVPRTGIDGVTRRYPGYRPKLHAESE